MNQSTIHVVQAGQRSFKTARRENQGGPYERTATIDGRGSVWSKCRVRGMTPRSNRLAIRHTLLYCPTGTTLHTFRSIMQAQTNFTEDDFSFWFPPADPSQNQNPVAPSTVGGTVFPWQSVTAHPDNALNVLAEAATLSASSANDSHSRLSGPSLPSFDYSQPASCQPYSAQPSTLSWPANWSSGALPPNPSGLEALPSNAGGPSHMPTLNYETVDPQLLKLQALPPTPQTDPSSARLGSPLNVPDVRSVYNGVSGVGNTDYRATPLQAAAPSLWSNNGPALWPTGVCPDPEASTSNLLPGTKFTSGFPSGSFVTCPLQTPPATLRQEPRGLMRREGEEEQSRPRPFVTGWTRSTGPSIPVWPSSPPPSTPDWPTCLRA